VKSRYIKVLGIAVDIEHGTNDRWNNLWIEIWAYLPSLLFQRHHHPSETNLQGYVHVAASKAIFLTAIYSYNYAYFLLSIYHTL
jgi:hypothetical protein